MDATVTTVDYTACELHCTALLNAMAHLTDTTDTTQVTENPLTTMYFLMFPDVGPHKMLYTS